MNDKEKRPVSPYLRRIGMVGDWIENLFLMIGALVLVFFFMSVVLDVGARTANNSLFWTQDTAIFSYFWCIFIAGAVCVRRNEHFSIELFSHLPKAGAFIKRLIVILVMCIFTFYIAKYGWDYAIMSWTRKQSASGLRLFYAIICMPIAGVGFGYFLLEQVICLFTGHELSDISKKHSGDKVAGKKEV